MTAYYVYILASSKKGMLYVGMTNSLNKRIYEHKNDLCNGFTKKNKVKKLVYYEQYNDKKSAMLREKQIKRWSKEWKIKLIEKNNPEWKDLYSDLDNSMG